MVSISGFSHDISNANYTNRKKRKTEKLEVKIKYPRWLKKLISFILDNSFPLFSLCDFWVSYPILVNINGFPSWFGCNKVLLMSCGKIDAFILEFLY